jgi:general secretion pathway protein J
MKCKRQHTYLSERGLTLIELLVAIGILAFIAVLGWRGLETLIRTRSSLDQELEQTRNLQIIFAQIQNDCAHIVSASQIDGQTPLLLAPNRLSLVRSVSLEAAPTQLQWVSYRLQNNSLVREVSPLTRDFTQLLSYDLQLNTNTNTNNAPVVLQTEVQNFGLRVWAKNGRAWLSSSAMQASPTTLVSRGSLMNPQTGSTASTITWRGLEVSLSLNKVQGELTKTILLGAT